MAVQYRRTRAWVAALAVTGVFGGTMYFAATANGDSGDSPVDTEVAAVAPAANNTTLNTITGQSQATVGPQTATKSVATPVPRAKKSRGS